MSDKCTCPCLDCIEGLHCGGLYYVEEIDQVVGVCDEPADESFLVDMGYEELRDEYDDEEDFYDEFIR